MTNFEEKIKYKFKDRSLLELALTHSSYAKENGLSRNKCNERLEFLGDAFFDAIIGEELYKIRPNDKEGVLSKTRADVVCETSLAKVARSLGMGDLIKMGKGEIVTKGNEKDSILADAVEAVIGAIYLESGYDTVKGVVLDLFKDLIVEAISGKLNVDYKSAFQEMMQKKGTVSIKYSLLKTDGPDHQKTFFVELTVDGEKFGFGVGKSKKEAEQAAAKSALVGDV
ncbi:MAG: ribonuclease III [Anaerovoracaceae bacterium]